MDRQFWVDALRNAKGLGQVGRAIVQPMIGDIPAGLTGLGTLMATGDLGKASQATNAVKDQFAYMPTTEEGQDYLGKVGEGIQYVEEKIPEPVKEGWYDFTAAQPLAAAALVGGLEVVDPTKGTGRGAKKAAKAAQEAAEAARIAALRKVREEVTAGPTFVSAVDEAIPKLQPQGTVGQYVGALRNMPGIKGEELADLGLDQWAPNQRLTREQFANMVKENRPEMGEILRKAEQFPVDSPEVQNAIDRTMPHTTQEVLDSPRLWRQLDLPALTGIEHPLEIKRSERILESLSPKQQDELYSTVMEHTINNSSVRDQLSAGEMTQAMEDMLDMEVDAKIRRAFEDEKLFNEMELDLAIGMDFDEARRSIGKDISPMQLQERLAQAGQWEPFQEAVRGHTTRLMMANPQNYGIGWRSGLKQGFEPPAYPNMRYFAEDQVDPGAAGSNYLEILQTAGPMAWAPDKRMYKEPHWPQEVGKSGNDVVAHLRMSDVDTPEGSPAMMIEEVQSKYASDVGKKGTTADPLSITPLGQVVDNEVERLLKLADDAADSEELAQKLENVLDEEFDADFKDDLDNILQDYHGASPKEQADMRDELQQLVADGKFFDYQHLNDPAVITHRGQPFEINGVPPAGAPEELAKQIALMNEGYHPTRPSSAQGVTPAGFDLEYLQRESPQWSHDTRLPPRPGTKSWRLRALKRALREAADRDANDLYFPTGEMMPAIEKWAGELGGFEDMPYDKRDKFLAERAVEVGEDMINEPGDPNVMAMVMANYQNRLPKEWGPYLKKFGATIEEDQLLPKGVKAKDLPGGRGPKARRIRFTPELLAEVLRGQKLYQLAPAAALLPLMMGEQQDEEPTY